MSYEYFFKLGKKHWKFFLLIFCFIFLISKAFAKEPDNKIEVEPIKKVEIKESIEEKTVLEKMFVDIKGAVVTPGVYQIKENFRIIDVIDLAGGLKIDADTFNVNLSKKVVDEMVIIIPYEGDEIEKIIIEYEEVEKDDGLININTASLNELTSLPGIGEVRAKDIIKYREEQRFEKIEDLLNVSGIGNATFDQIKNLVKV